ncbi:MAG TPA: hypothetical protein VNN21_09890, partial [Dehalococcoidia bacterium]|nr:hypothetical protein [Dehalococcoidia bacterium]
SSEPLSLEGWTLTGPEGRIALPDVTLAAQGFTVGGSGESFLAPFPDFAGLVAFVTTLEWGDALAREGGWIELADPQGVLVDGVSWGTDASILSVAPAALQASHSMERLPAGLDRDVADDFVENTAPTPGRGLSTTHADDSATVEEAAAWTGALFAALAGLAAGAYALGRHPKPASPDEGKDGK